MVSSGPPGFYKAPVSKAILGVVGASSLVASVLEWKPWLPLDLERVLENGQVWRLATHHLAFRTSGELFIWGFVLYSLRLFERRYGTAKFAAFAAVTSVLATLFQVALLTLGRSLGYTIRAAAPGPYGLLCALMVPYLRDLPVTYTLNIGALSFSYKWFVYLPVVQLAFIAYPESALAMAAGFLAGLFYAADIGSVQRWRFPARIQQLCTQYVLPHLASSPGPAPPGLRGNGGGGMAGFGGGMPAPLQRAPSPPAAYEPPAEATIAELESMGFPRAAVLGALRAANNDVARAVDLLVQQAAL